MAPLVWVKVKPFAFTLVDNFNAGNLACVATPSVEITDPQAKATELGHVPHFAIFLHRNNRAAAFARPVSRDTCQL